MSHLYSRTHSDSSYHNSTDKIVRGAGNLKGKTVIEVGPGPGSLTRSLLKTEAKKVIAVEKDQRFKPALATLEDASAGRLKVLHKGLGKND